MPSNQPVKSTVRHALLKKTKVADALAILDNTCSSGAQCQEVQSSPVTKAALTNLQTTVTTAHGSLGTKKSCAQALLAAAKVLGIDYGQAKLALGAYEAAVETVANGDASIMNKAGLLSRETGVPHAALGQVTGAKSTPGKAPREAIISWPPVPGATSYALQANFAPLTQGSAYTAQSTGSRRRRVLTAPSPGAQFLVQVAAVSSDGTQSAWSDPVMATAR